MDEGEPRYVRFAHFSLDANPVTVIGDDIPTTVHSLDFGEITDWYRIPDDIHTLTLQAETGEPLATASVSVDDAQWLTLALIGSTALDTLRIQKIEIDHSELAPGESRLGVLHAIENLGSINVLVNDNALFQFINYPQIHDEADGYIYADVIAKTYDPEFVSNVLPSQEILDIPPISLQTGTVYFLALIGTAEEPTFIITATDISTTILTTPLIPTQSDETAQLRITHLSSGTPPIDVYVDSELSTLRGLTFTSITDFSTLSAGTHAITITPETLPPESALLPSFDVELETGSQFTLAFIGAADNDSLDAILLEEAPLPQAEGQFRLDVFQAIPGLPPVNLQLSDGTDLIRLLGYPGSQGDNDGYESLILPEGDYDLHVVQAANPDDIIVDLPLLRFNGGQVYFLAIIRADPAFVLRSAHPP